MQLRAQSTWWRWGQRLPFTYLSCDDSTRVHKRPHFYNWLLFAVQGELRDCTANRTREARGSKVMLTRETRKTYQWVPYRQHLPLVTASYSSLCVTLAHPRIFSQRQRWLTLVKEIGIFPHSITLLFLFASRFSMPFATLDRTHKRIRSEDPYIARDGFCPQYATARPSTTGEEFNFGLQQFQYKDPSTAFPTFQPLPPHHRWADRKSSSTGSHRIRPSTSPTDTFAVAAPVAPTSIFASNPPTPLEHPVSSAESVDSEPLHPRRISSSTVNNNNSNNSNDNDINNDDSNNISSSTAVSAAAATWPFSDEESYVEETGSEVALSPILPASSDIIQEALSKFKLSYTDKGINMEARISNVSDLRTLIDAFSKLCSISSASGTNINVGNNERQNASGVILYRNPNHRTRPVNFFASVCRLGQLHHPHSKHGPLVTLREIADACIQTYFTCWVRYTPILRKDEFMAWYDSHPAATETLIVNAICAFVFQHMVIHHGRPGLSHFLNDHNQIQEQEEFFFDRARECLSQSFDCPSRYDVVALLFMSARAEPSKRHHYVGMAVSALHNLEIYPRMAAHADDDSYDKEMDTRLWWFAWAMDFSFYSAGAPKNTPQTKYPGPVDTPRLFEQDIDEGEIAVLTLIHCLKFWRLQADIIHTFYEHDSDMTVEQLRAYDKRILEIYNALPDYFRFDSGFEYGCEDLFSACVRVNIEYHATRIILHKLFIPDITDPHPSSFSLESLNICLSLAFNQLRALNTCTKSLLGRCAFDRDEFWRAAEIISMAKDIFRDCASPIILQGIDAADFERGLSNAQGILLNTREYKARVKNWIQVADWLDVEIRRHQLHSHPNRKNVFKEATVAKAPDYFLANVKPSAKSQELNESHHQLSPSGPLLSVLSFSNTFSSSSASANTPISSSGIFPSTAVTPCAPTMVHFNYSTFSNTTTTTNAAATATQISNTATATPATTLSSSSSSSTTTTSRSTSSKNQPRFRYFNPRKMNKFLFIDENPSF